MQKKFLWISVCGKILEQNKGQKTDVANSQTKERTGRRREKRRQRSTYRRGHPRKLPVGTETAIMKQCGSRGTERRHKINMAPQPMTKRKTERTSQGEIIKLYSSRVMACRLNDKQKNQVVLSLYLNNCYTLIQSTAAAGVLYCRFKTAVGFPCAADSGEHQSTDARP